MAYFSHDIINQVKQRADIVALIGRDVPLKQAGNVYKGICPFHEEKTPSFIVNPDKRSYHCFGCGQGGSVFSFLTDHRQLSFADAVRDVARQCGIPLPEPKDQQTPSTELYAVLKEATAYFHQALMERPEATIAREYLLSTRALTLDTIHAHELGYAFSHSHHLVHTFTKRGIAPDLLVEAGLASQDSHYPGRYRDRFIERIMFPIRDQQNRVIGFGARRLHEPTEPDAVPSPKYLNSKENDLFKKQDTLYLLHAALPAMQADRTLIFVEGYLDALTLHQAGFCNTVATMGTALTERHVLQLQRSARQLVMMFDGDAAGLRAGLRALPILLNSGLRIFVASLPPGQDPDSLVRQHGPAGLRTILDTRLSLMEWMVARLQATRRPATMDTYRDLLAHCTQAINHIHDPLYRAGMHQTLHEALAVPTVPTLVSTPPQPDTLTTLEHQIGFALVHQLLSASQLDRLSANWVRPPALRLLIKSLQRQRVEPDHLALEGPQAQATRSLIRWVRDHPLPFVLTTTGIDHLLHLLEQQAIRAELRRLPSNPKYPTTKERERIALLLGRLHTSAPL